MGKDMAAEVLEKDAKQSSDCRDRDEDCDDIVDKVGCYLYDPAKGFCPFLRKPS